MKIIWSPLAVEQVRDIATYIALDKPPIAKAWVEEIFTCVDRLLDFPRSGRIAPEIGQDTIREIIHGSYRIIYKTKRSELLILVVKYDRQRITPKDISP